HLDAMCAKYFVPEEVHPQLPSPDATMHERPAGKVGLYTRFFDYANYQQRAENVRLLFTVALLTYRALLSTSVVRSSGELSASVEREFVEDASVGDGEDQGFDSVGGQDNVEPIVPIMSHVGRASIVTTGGSATGGKSPSVLNRLLQDSRLMVEQGVPALPTLHFITSSMTTSPLEEGGDQMTPLTWSAVPVMTEATTVATIATTVAILLMLARIRVRRIRSSGFAAGSIRAEEVIGFCLEEIYVPEWTVTKGFELNDGHSCANMIDHFTPPAFFKTPKLVLGFPALRPLRVRFEAKLLPPRNTTASGARMWLFENKGDEPREIYYVEKDRVVLRFLSRVSIRTSQVVAGRDGYKLTGMTTFFSLWAKCLQFDEYRRLWTCFLACIEKGMQEGLAAGIEHGQAGRCLTDLEAYIPSAEVDFNSVVRDLRDLDFRFFAEYPYNKDLPARGMYDFFRLDDAVAEALGMTDLQPDVSQLMVPIHHKQDRSYYLEQALSVSLVFCCGSVVKMERNLLSVSPYCKDVILSPLVHPLSAEL
ncbi:hypothetical protein Tco_0617810, partial [Tanacetum coccineum]